MKKNDLTEKEVLAFLKHRSEPALSSSVYNVGEKRVKFLLMGDSHMGHVEYGADINDHAAKVAKNESVDFIIHGGDIIEGHYEHHRHGHIYDLTHLGADQQVRFAVEELSKFDAPLFFITGNHETNSYYHSVGHDIGESLEQRMTNAHYLGRQHGSIELAYGRKIQIIHPDGGTAYAISYKSQKIIESLEGGTKPDLLTIHHFHKAEYLYYRNVHAIQAGCLQHQSSFMKNHGISAHTGFWLVDLDVGPAGVASINTRFFPHYKG